MCRHYEGIGCAIINPTKGFQLSLKEGKVFEYCSGRDSCGRSLDFGTGRTYLVDKYSGRLHNSSDWDSGWIDFLEESTGKNLSETDRGFIDALRKEYATPGTEMPRFMVIVEKFSKELKESSFSGIEEVLKWAGLPGVSGGG
ncbi:MAG: TusE/DsrC/DsvC family sulfur relay protein [Candidatus Moranbacteria bacterium]|nr:TusE/DsrC/DsvC family sulfur relay protein [Candidatus Moranbacteria bacterium]